MAKKKIKVKRAAKKHSRIASKKSKKSKIKKIRRALKGRKKKRR